MYCLLQIQRRNPGDMAPLKSQWCNIAKDYIHSDKEVNPPPPSLMDKFSYTTVSRDSIVLFGELKLCVLK